MVFDQTSLGFPYLISPSKLLTSHLKSDGFRVESQDAAQHLEDEIMVSQLKAMSFSPTDRCVGKGAREVAIRSYPFDFLQAYTCLHL